MHPLDGVRELLHRFAEEAEDLIFVIDPVTGIKCLNPRIPRGMQVVERSSGAEPFAKLLLENGFDLLALNARKVLESGGTAAFEERLNFGGRDLWLDTRLSPINDLGGKPVAVLGISRDITDRKEREALTSNSRREWLKAVDGMPYLLAVIGRNHRIERVNAAMAERLGSTVRRAVGLVCYEELHGAKEPPPFCPLRSGAGTPDHTAEIVERHLGGDCIGSVSPVRNAQAEVTGCLYIGRDLSPMDRSLDVQRSSEEYMRMLLKTAELTVYVQDSEGKYIFFRAMPGERIPWDIIGKSPFDFFEASVASKLVERARRVAVKGKELTEQMEFRWGGETLQFFDRISPVSDAMGRIKAVATISMKVAEFRSTPKGGSVAGLSPGSGGFPAALTAREREVLQLVATGLTSGEIAARLDISRKTVETHRAKIMRKLDLHKTSALVSYAARSGLL